MLFIFCYKRRTLAAAVLVNENECRNFGYFTLGMGLEIPILLNRGLRPSGEVGIGMDDAVPFRIRRSSKQTFPLD